MEREEMLESIREANKEAELFKQICCAMLEEKKLQQIIDRCQYDEGNSEWVLPVIKPARDSDFRLPDIDAKYGVSVDESSSSNPSRERGPSASRRPQSGQNQQNANSNFLPKRPSSRTTSREEAIAPKPARVEETSTSIPSLNVPSYAPAKPPMPRSARRYKKKSKSNGAPTPTGYEPVMNLFLTLTHSSHRMNMVQGKMLGTLQNGALL
jgi:hypothetical protein